MYKMRKLNVEKIALTEFKRDEYLSKGFELVVDQSPVEENPLDKMTVNDLKTYATNKSIDITGLTKKEDIIKKIKETEQGA